MSHRGQDAITRLCSTQMGHSGMMVLILILSISSVQFLSNICSDTVSMYFLVIKDKMARMTVRRCGGSRRTRSRTQRVSTKRSMPWAGWSKESPRHGRERNAMKRNCSKGKCFLGPGTSFPVCRTNTCTISDKGLWAAYIRAKQWGKPTRSYKGKARPSHGREVYTKAALTAKRLLTQRGFKVGE
jgi:hypothetical protein